MIGAALLGGFAIFILTLIILALELFKEINRISLIVSGLAGIASIIFILLDLSAPLLAMVIIIIIIGLLLRFINC